MGGGKSRKLIENGGEGGIRTLGTRKRTTVFETAPFNHSGTSPPVARSADGGTAGLSRRVCGAGGTQGSTPPASGAATRCLTALFALCPAGPRGPDFGDFAASGTVDMPRRRRIFRPHSTDRRRKSRSALFLQEHSAPETTRRRASPGPRLFLPRLNGSGRCTQ